MRGLDGRLANEPVANMGSAVNLVTPPLSPAVKVCGGGVSPAAPAAAPAIKEHPPMSLLTGRPLDELPAAIPATKLVEFSGRLLMVGMGAIGMASLPLIIKHVAMDVSRITVLTGDDRAVQAAQMAREYPGLNTTLCYLVESNYEAELAKYLGDGDMLVNLSVDVSSVALMRWCAAHGVAYMDTCTEPWAGYYTDKALSPSARTNYALREAALALRAEFGPAAPTAILTHGANPGMVSHLVKEALLHIAAKQQPQAAPPAAPATRLGWAQLAESLGLRIIHIAERDTQVQATPREHGQFVNTWSVEGFIAEGSQPAELGWGTHEKALPPKGARHAEGCDAAIYINRPGAATRVRTWTPLEGPFHGFLITHNEAISLADFLTVGGGRVGTPARYRPTVHYAYHPCPDAIVSLHEFAGKSWKPQTEHKILCDEIVAGKDELGVLLMGTNPATGEHYSYWYGSQLDIAQARKLAPHNSATTLQVSSSVLAATVWAMRNPRRGLLECEDLPHTDILSVILPYMAPVVGVFSDWTPLENRCSLFDEDIDRADPWQFKNIVVE